MLKKGLGLVGICIVVFVLMSFESGNVWGFYAHRLINQIAIFTLPPELIFVFKKNLKAIEEYSTAPDTRRYSSPHEASRHYIDIDHWGTFPFPNLPRKHSEAVWQNAVVLLIDSKNADTLNVKSEIDNGKWPKSGKDSLMHLYYRALRFGEFEDDIVLVSEARQFVSLDSVPITGRFDKILFKDVLKEYGILPYHLVEMQNRLTLAFSGQKIDEIIRIAGEMGHYIADAHVPLHTTENYNGQLTNQLGIHAFWETRIPELFAENSYDFWLGNAVYIKDKQEYFWSTVLESHIYVEEVLKKEKELSLSYEQDQQYCQEERLGITQRIECADYAMAYQNSLNGMVERQLQNAILAVGSSWYTAWVDAGSPKLIPEIATFQMDSTLISNKLEIKNLRVQ